MPIKPETELTEASRRLVEFAEGNDAAPERIALDAIWQRAREIAGSASGSWIGYHANVYYKDFQQPPAGAHFDVEYGTGGAYFAGRDNNWVEHTAQDVYDLLVDEPGKASLLSAEAQAETGLLLLNSTKADVSSVLTVYLGSHEDKFVRRLADEIEGMNVLGATDIANERLPKRKIITSDMRAVGQGTLVPPHVNVQARVTAAHQPAAHCRELRFLTHRDHTF